MEYRCCRTVVHIQYIATQNQVLNPCNTGIYVIQREHSEFSKTDHRFGKHQWQGGTHSACPIMTRTLEGQVHARRSRRVGTWTEARLAEILSEGCRFRKHRSCTWHPNKKQGTEVEMQCQTPQLHKKRLAQPQATENFLPSTNPNLYSRGVEVPLRKKSDVSCERLDEYAAE